MTLEDATKDKNMIYQMPITNHARKRIRQRGFKEVDMEIIHIFGEEVTDGYFMTTNATNKAREVLKAMLKRLDKLNGKIIIAPNGVIVTAYKPHKKRLRHLLSN